MLLPNENFIVFLKDLLIKSSSNQTQISLSDLDQIHSSFPSFDHNSQIDSFGNTFLNLSVQLSNEVFVEYLITKTKVNLNKGDCLGRTPLHFAALKQNVKILNMLIISLADVNSKSVSGETPLIKAVKFGRVDNVKVLLRFGADSFMRVNVRKIRNYCYL